MSIIISSVIFICLLLAIGFVKFSVKWHERAILTVFGADVALVTFLVLARKALGKISVSMPTILIIHIGFALTTLLVYAYCIRLGFLLKAGHEHYRKDLRRGAVVLVVIRLMNLLTSMAYVDQKLS